jgi:hypothetical protein
MKRAFLFAAATLLFASAAQAQGTSIEKCTGNFEEAQLKEKRGKLLEAEQLYAACADPKCPGMIRTDCSAKRDEVLRRIPTVTVVVRDASGNDLPSYVEIDGKPLADRARAQPLDPGEHVVSYRPDGKKPATQKITVVEGEKARVISITAKEGKDAEPAVPPPEQPAKPQESHSIVAPVIVGSIGVIALIAGVGLQILAVGEDSKRADLQAQADASTSQAERDEFEAAARSRRSSAENNQLFAIITGASGLVLIGTGVVLYFATKPSSSKSAVVPVVAPGYAGLGYGLRF